MVSRKAIVGLLVLSYRDISTFWQLHKGVEKEIEEKVSRETIVSLLNELISTGYILEIPYEGISGYIVTDTGAEYLTDYITKFTLDKRRN